MVRVIVGDNEKYQSYIMGFWELVNYLEDDRLKGKAILINPENKKVNIIILKDVITQRLIDEGVPFVEYGEYVLIKTEYDYLISNNKELLYEKPILCCTHEVKYHEAKHYKVKYHEVKRYNTNYNEFRLNRANKEWLLNITHEPTEDDRKNIRKLITVELNKESPNEDNLMDMALKGFKNKLPESIVEQTIVEELKKY